MSMGSAQESSGFPPDGHDLGKRRLFSRGQVSKGKTSRRPRPRRRGETPAPRGTGGPAPQSRRGAPRREARGTPPAADPSEPPGSGRLGGPAPPCPASTRAAAAGARAGPGEKTRNQGRPAPAPHDPTGSRPPPRREPTRPGEQEH